MSDAELPLRTRVAYGVGATAESSITMAFNSFNFLYYNNVLELSGTLCGLAVTIADEGKIGGKSVDKLAREALKKTSVSAYLQRFHPTPEGYALAGSFVRYLVREHGMPRVAQFFREHGSAGSLDQGIFGQVFGTTLESALGDWLKAL